MADLAASFFTAFLGGLLGGACGVWLMVWLMKPTSWPGGSPYRDSGESGRDLRSGRTGL